MQKQYQVLELYNPQKDYGKKVQTRFCKVLSLLVPGTIVTQDELVQTWNKEFKKSQTKDSNTIWLVSRAFRLGKSIGILKEREDLRLPYEEFCKLESVSYYAKQLRGSKIKNLQRRNKYEYSTRIQYLYKLWDFNNYLHGKTFDFTTHIPQAEKGVYKKEKRPVKLDTIEDLLNLHRESRETEFEISKIIVNYLLDTQHHGTVGSGYVKSKRSAINGYFEKNGSTLKVTVDPGVSYNDEEISQGLLSLSDIYKMLSTRVSLLEKGVVLCKFHRGLDNQTFVDRFNFEAWQQLVDYFGTENYSKWDTTKCPVPIKIIRIKTNFEHIGFLDVDAIEVLKDYLAYRQEQTKGPMIEGQAIFLNQYRDPISELWLGRLVPRLATNAGIQNKFMINGKPRNQKTSHETRDLLKSTLVTSGAKQYVCELAIGHKPDSYEKNSILYPEEMRLEFMKASSKINIFSKITNYLKGNKEIEIMQEQVDSMNKLNNEFSKKAASSQKRDDRTESNLEKILSKLDYQEKKIEELEAKLASK